MASLVIADYVTLYTGVITTAGTNYKAGTATNTREALSEANNFFQNIKFGNKNFRKDQGTGQIRNATPDNLAVVMNPLDVNICNTLVASGLFNETK
jgi:hypothetical protein